MSCGLRDMAEFEQEGTPAVLVASSAFTTTAEEQAAKLGQPRLRRVFVSHPVQDRTDDELQEAARRVLDDALAALEGGRD